jgi:hypothetical protein
MPSEVKAKKKEIFGVFDGHMLIEIGSRELAEKALPYAGKDGEIISLAHMSPSILRLRKAEVRLQQEDIPWRKRSRRPSERDYALCFSVREDDKELEAQWTAFVCDAYYERVLASTRYDERRSW